MVKKYNKGGQEIRVKPYYQVPYLKNIIYCVICFILSIYVIEKCLTVLTGVSL